MKLNKIKVIVAGFRGKMGVTAVQMILNAQNFELVALLGKKEEVSEAFGVPVFSRKEDLTGFTDDEVADLIKFSREKELGGLIAPNFALGAVLLMQFSKQAVKYFPDVEIIELHHDGKKDAPSGTAVKTAELMSEERLAHHQGAVDEKEALAGARGADLEGMRIHSVRLPGLVAHQEVIFGSKGEGLTLRHDSYDRSSFMTGIALGIRKVMTVSELKYGLEHFLDL